MPNQGFHVFRLKGMTAHASISQLVQLVCHQRELALPLHLGAKASFPVMPAELFQLVVQASHSVFRFQLSVSDRPGVVTIRAHLSENSLGTPLPYDLNMPGLRQHRLSL